MKKSGLKKTAPLNKATIWQYLKIFSGVKLPWLFWGLMLVSSLLMVIASSSMAFDTGAIVGSIDASGAVDTPVIASFVTALVLIGICSSANTLFGEIASQRINRGLRGKLWKKMMYIPQNVYDNDSGESLVSRVTTDCDFASTFFSQIVSIFTALMSTVAYIGQMYANNVTLSNYTMLMLPLSVVVGWLYGRARYYIGKKTQGTLADSTEYLIERTRGLSLIKTAGTAENEAKMGDEMFQAQYSVDIKNGYLNATYLFLNQFMGTAGQLIPFVFGAALVAQGIMDVSMVVTFYMFSMSVGTSFSNFINYFGTIKNAVGSLERVINTLAIDSEDVNSGKSMDVDNEDIRLQNVTFGYGEAPVLQNVDCVIPKNKVTAVIGANGSGKSTLFKLLERIYAPDSGAILFGDTPVESFGLNAWRRTFSTVAQGSPVMEGTIRENITYGCERSVSEEELVKVARMANILELVQSLPDGFDSYVAPGGSNFSGGQRQCIAIARAIMNNPDYLLLDEATSNLDARSTRAVTDALGELMRDRTTVVIAHDLATIRRADNVLVLKNGYAAASGDPAEIIRNTQEYNTEVFGKKA